MHAQQGRHSINAYSVRKPTSFFATVQKCLIAGSSCRDCSRLIAIKQQRHSTVKKPVVQRGEGDQRLNAVLWSDAMHHLNKAPYIVWSHGHQRRIPSQTTAVKSRVQGTLLAVQMTTPLSKRKRGLVRTPFHKLQGLGQGCRQALQAFAS